MKRNLSKFLFGAISADGGVDVGKDEEAPEESDSDDEEWTSSDESVKDLDDVDIDVEVGDEDKGDVEEEDKGDVEEEEFDARVDSEAGFEVDEDKEDIDDTDNTDSESDTVNDAEKLPEDIYGNNLYLRNVKKI